ncbi:MAG: DUF192 domain-containing protein [Thermoleophilaceae bacterium]|nr:DUF192 domain-containing protein [Thermoleophilaceae bacterium]
MLPPRLARLPVCAPAEGLVVAIARGPRARLAGLALADGLPPGVALALPRCRSVHTFGMRFAIDVAFITPAGVEVREAVPASRVVVGPRDAHALETRAGESGPFLRGPALRRLRLALEQ